MFASQPVSSWPLAWMDPHSPFQYVFKPYTLSVIEIKCCAYNRICALGSFSLSPKVELEATEVLYIVTIKIEDTDIGMESNNFSFVIAI